MKMPPRIGRISVGSAFPWRRDPARPDGSQHASRYRHQRNARVEGDRDVAQAQQHQADCHQTKRLHTPQ